MWKWVSENYEKYSNVHRAKGAWLVDNGYPELIHGSACFFCLYTDPCCGCPARQVDDDFHCVNSEGYDYLAEPKAFYAKLVELDKKRRAK
jgi:hypothetical protein